MDYWTLISQPSRFIALAELYYSIENRVREEQYRKIEKQTKKAKRKRGIKR